MFLPVFFLFFDKVSLSYLYGISVHPTSFLKATDFILFKSLTQVFSNNFFQVLLVGNGRIWKEDKNVNNVLLAASSGPAILQYVNGGIGNDCKTRNKLRFLQAC